ncbi:UDP-glucuronate 4-epimerase 3 [Senna tora]|uniref:UDP-glucuronate 4-epimerase n=1 Tax=Senna tora TaxID=362788 RepID=A0A834X152_9FABA|nr:UDP-glucuronate 4-epimerase 3 [Senna tora]
MVDKPSSIHRARYHFSLSKLLFWSLVFLGFIVFFFFRSPPSASPSRRSLRGGAGWENSVRQSATPRYSSSSSSAKARRVLVTGAAGFVGAHVSIALKRRGDGVVGLDNYNKYYDPSLKRARTDLLRREGVFIVEGDINDAVLLRELFRLVKFTHVMHLAAQAGVRYAMKNPASYVHSNIAGLVSLFEVCKSANPQPAIVWASSSSVYGLNSKVPFSEKDRTDQPASLYAATKKAGEEIAHTYNHIYGLSITGLRFFTVYGPWGRPDMAYFFFTKDILKGKQISIFEGPNHSSVARDFTYIDDIVKGCLGALDTAKKSTGSGGKKMGPAQLRVFNLGNTSPVPVSKLVSILEKLLKVKAKKKILPMPSNGDVLFTHANISSATREIGYKPSTDLQTGVIFMNVFSTLTIIDVVVPPVNIATMASSEEVPEKLVTEFCSKTKDPSFCHNFAKGDIQTFLGMETALRTKVLDTAIDITTASKSAFSGALGDKQVTEKEKAAIQQCIGLYTKVEQSLQSSASPSADFIAIGQKLQVAGESLWQCQMDLHSHPNHEAIASLKMVNGLANSFVSYVQSEFYAHYLQLNRKN